MDDIECPKCGAPMVMRKGKHGKFMGCTEYPDCKGTVNFDDEGEPEQWEKSFKQERDKWDSENEMELDDD